MSSKIVWSVSDSTHPCDPQKSTKMAVSAPWYLAQLHQLTSFADNPSRGDLAWGEEVIRLESSKYSVTVPAGLKNGQYILRHEVYCTVSFPL